MPERATESDDTAEILTYLQDSGDSDTANLLMEIYEATERVYRATVVGNAPVGSAASTNAED